MVQNHVESFITNKKEDLNTARERELLLLAFFPIVSVRDLLIILEFVKNVCEVKVKAGYANRY